MADVFNLSWKLIRAGLAFLPEPLTTFDPKDVLKLEVDDIRYRFSYVDRFMELPKDNTTFELDDATLATLEATAEVAITGNKMWMLSGTNASNDDVTFVASGLLPGMAAQTDGAAADQVLFTPRTETGFVSMLAGLDWAMEKQPAITAVLTRLHANSADDYLLVIGFSDTVDNDPTAATDACLLEITSVANVVTCKLRTAVNGVDTDETVNGISNTTLPATGNTVGNIRKLAVVIDSQRKAHVFFNDVEIFKSAIQLRASSAANSMLPLFGHEQTETGGGAEPLIHWAAVKVGINYA